MRNLESSPLMEGLAQALSRAERSLTGRLADALEQQGHALLADAGQADLRRLQELLEAFAGRIR